MGGRQTAWGGGVCVSDRTTASGASALGDSGKWADHALNKQRGSWGLAKGCPWGRRYSTFWNHEYPHGQRSSSVRCTDVW